MGSLYPYRLLIAVFSVYRIGNDITARSSPIGDNRVKVRNGFYADDDFRKSFGQEIVKCGTVHRRVVGQRAGESARIGTALLDNLCVDPGGGPGGELLYPASVSVDAVVPPPGLGLFIMG